MNLRISTRIAAGFGAMVLLNLGIGVYSLARQADSRTFTAEMRSRDLAMVGTFALGTQFEGEMRVHREKVLAVEFGSASRQGGADSLAEQQQWRRAMEGLTRTLAEADSSLQEYESSTLSPARTAGWAQIHAAVTDAARILADDLQPAVERSFALIQQGRIEEAQNSIAAMDADSASFIDAMSEVRRRAQDQVDLGAQEAEDSYLQARESIVLALLATLFVGIACSIVIQRSVTRPLAQFQAFAAKVGQGDLTSEADASRQDEMGEMAGSLNGMVEALRIVAQQTRGAAESLGAATTQILASTQQQAASSAEQAAAVQQTNATLTEISQSGSQISERAKQVAASAESTSGASEAGLKAAQDTSRIMEGIREQAEAVADNVVALSERTQTVGEIIATVNDIAEQSHLLALNAAIEAAAAGEQGRSFSVVATEIKNLADQSKEATLQVRSILGEIQKGINSSVMLTEEAVKRVESGKKQAEVTDKTIRELASSVERSVQAFQQIVAGTNQQQIGLDQITQAVRDIGQASGQAAAGTQQLEQAASNVNAMAQQLRTAVEQYKL
jgi:methyl-accepting chemotaxis protein